MPRARVASDEGLEPHWKVRVVFPGSIIHLASWTEPVVRVVGSDRTPVGMMADWITEPTERWWEYGDTVGYVDWEAALAITWRWSP